MKLLMIEDGLLFTDMEVVNFPLELGAMNSCVDLNGIIGLELLQQIKTGIDSVSIPAI